MLPKRRRYAGSSLRRVVLQESVKAIPSGPINVLIPSSNFTVGGYIPAVSGSTGVDVQINVGGPVVPTAYSPVVSITGGTGDNEPAGFTEIFDQPWDNVPDDPAGDPAEWELSAGGSNVAIGSDPTAPESPPNILVGTMPTTHDTSSGYAPFDLEKRINILAAGATEVYFRWRQKLSTNWQAHRNGSKVMLCWGLLGAGDPDGGPAYYSGMQSIPSVPLGSSFQDHVDAPMYFEMNVQGVTGNSQTRYPRNAGASGANAVIRGVWQTFEVYLKLNPVAGDGTGSIIRYWVDNVLCGDYEDEILVGTGDESGFGLLYEFTAVYGGGESDPITQDCTISCDHIYMSGNQ